MKRLVEYFSFCRHNRRQINCHKTSNYIFSNLMTSSKLLKDWSLKFLVIVTFTLEG